jgi:hypothetical protein
LKEIIIASKYIKIIFATEPTRLYDIEGKKAVCVPDLGLGHPFIELPKLAEKAYFDAKNGVAMRNLCLVVYAGRSLLTGKGYYRFSIPVTGPRWDHVKRLFEISAQERMKDSKVGSLWTLRRWKIICPSKIRLKAEKMK